MLSNIPLIGQAKIFNQNEEIIALNPMLDLNRSNALNWFIFNQCECKNRKHPHFIVVSALTDQVNYIDIHSGSGKVLPEGSWIN
jgi:hypothetical protein